MATIERTPYQATWRDKIAVTFANAALRLATPEYRGFVMRATKNELARAERAEAYEGWKVRHGRWEKP